MVRTGCNTVEEAETWALLQGMQIAWENGVTKLIVEGDSLVVIRWIKGTEESMDSLSNIIQERKELLQRDWMPIIRHIHREGNMVVDKDMLGVSLPRRV